MTCCSATGRRDPAGRARRAGGAAEALASKLAETLDVRLDRKVAAPSAPAPDLYQEERPKKWPSRAASTVLMKRSSAGPSSSACAARAASTTS